MTYSFCTNLLGSEKALLNLLPVQVLLLGQLCHKDVIGENSNTLTTHTHTIPHLTYYLETVSKYIPKIGTAANVLG